MKKIILSLLIVTSFTISFAQKANVSKAKNKALMETPDFPGAREAIQLALKDSTTKNDANTWYVAGLVDSKENDLLYVKAVARLPLDTIAKGKAMMKSYSYLIVADSLDQLPDAKGKVKPRFRKQIKELIKDFYTKSENLISWGAYLYEKEKYQETVKVFEVYLGIPNLPLMGKEIPIDSTYKKIKYFTGVAFSKAKLYKKSISIFEDLKSDTYRTNDVYQLLSEEYNSLKDSVRYVKTLKDGLEKFPSEPWFMQNLINYYIRTNKISDALIYLNSAILREPNNFQYQLVKGQLYLTLENYDEAIPTLKKAIELDPTKPEAYAELGRAYYNNAVKMSKEASKIKDTNQFKAEDKKIDLVYREAIPFYKKAIELNQQEVEYKLPLKQLYYRLQMDAEYEAISKEIKAAQAK